MPEPQSRPAAKLACREVKRTGAAIVDADRLAYTISAASRASGLGRTTLFTMIASGRLEARKAGRRTLILAESLRGLLAGLPPARRGSRASR